MVLRCDCLNVRVTEDDVTPIVTRPPSLTPTAPAAPTASGTRLTISMGFGARECEHDRNISDHDCCDLWLRRQLRPQP